MVLEVTPNRSYEQNATCSNPLFIQKNLKIEVKTNNGDLRQILFTGNQIRDHIKVHIGERRFLFKT